MKYVIAVFVTTIVVFLGATIYYKGLPTFVSPGGVSVESTSTPPATTSAPKNETEASYETFMKEIRDAFANKYGSSASSLTISVSKIEGEYAKGTASDEGGGGMWFAARLNGKWTLVWDGNGIITCDDVSPFPEFPASMIPECWDTSTEKMVIR